MNIKFKSLKILYYIFYSKQIDNNHYNIPYYAKLYESIIYRDNGEEKAAKKTKISFQYPLVLNL